MVFAPLGAKLAHSLPVATLKRLFSLLLYGLAVVPAAPAIRATVLCLAYGVSQLTRRSRDGPLESQKDSRF